MNKKTITTAIAACGFVVAVSLPLAASAGEHCSSGEDKCAVGEPNSLTQHNEKERLKKHDLHEYSDKSQASAVPIKTLLEGKTYGEWSAEWHKWAYSSPTNRNPIKDEDGAFCAENQPKGNVWFLAGSFGKEIVRSCPIPANKTLFYPIIEGGWIDCPGTPDVAVPDAIVRQVVAGLAAGDGASLLTSTLDGVPVSSLQIPIVRTQSPKFTAILPVDHVLGDPSCGFVLPAGETGRIISEGYWVMLPPLTPGEHELILHGASVPFNFDNKVTYKLTVLAERHHNHK